MGEQASGPGRATRAFGGADVKTANRTGLVIGASGGIGSAIEAEMRRRGFEVDGLSRSANGLDLADEASVIEAARSLSDARYDRIVVSTGVLTVRGTPPETSFRRLDPEIMARSFAVNTVGPALAIKHFAPLLRRDRLAVFAVLSARVGSIGDNRLGGWMSYRASKAALNQVLRCASIEFARKFPEACFAAVHPGTIPSELSTPYARDRFTATPTEAGRQLNDVMDGLSAADNGGFFAYDGSVIEW
ncbi:MAG: SDR family NAD(P)-dependent oxidoreductase [Proteobacteria bacterium]|nr:SDR family NAD(P)-dependent oxidoreductase [Pseudomonadota bacterium]